MGLGQEIVDNIGAVVWHVVVMKFLRVLDVASAVRNPPFQSFEYLKVESCIHSSPGKYEFMVDNASDVKEDNEHGFDPGLAHACLLGVECATPNSAFLSQGHTQKSMTHHRFHYTVKFKIYIFYIEFDGLANLIFYFLYRKGRNSNQVVNKWKKILPETLVNENSSADNLKEKQKSSPKTASKFYSKDKNTSQLIIDAGQKELGAKHCPSCNMLYTSGDQDDERTHKKYHNSYLAKLNFLGWKKERVLGEFSDGRIIMVLPSDPKYMMKKLKTIEQIIDR
ncbi:uncharacterized protein LOC111616245 [Centruroides sculpturatus]|uniref:uncharacterized protein LOC111616245 n=1 Tax=Centruroides sculpturatus TaxID=218467 RepID=UPI000C6CD94A|nr:uncharacterized protein LOC111616245 [Centruroides sculpturatus]